MKRLLDTNPVTGVTTWFEYDEHCDQMTISYEQVVSPLLDYTHHKATQPDYTAKGIKADMWHYARIPEIVQYEMLYKHGVDIHNKAHRKRMFELLNTEYKRCKTTEKTHVGS
jgi:hypothetical protein